MTTEASPRGGTGHQTLAADATSARSVLAGIRDVVAGRPELLQGRLEVLRRLDAEGRGDYVRSLRAYFDHSGDVPRAAAELSLHPNTLRYRLRRMRELAGLDLNDPFDRLVTELQLRLLDADDTP